MWDPQATEITLDHKGVSTNSYAIGGSRPLVGEALRLYALTVEHAPELLAPPYPDIREWELIDFTRANGTNYPEDMISISYSTCPSAELLEHFAVSVPEQFDPVDVYTIKVGLTSGRKVLKVYDKILANHPHPELPPDCQWAERHGVGLHLNAETHARFRDIYFYSYHDVDVISQYFDVPLPAFSYPIRADGLRGYGMLYDCETLEIIKVKGYFYPRLLSTFTHVGMS